MCCRPAPGPTVQALAPHQRGVQNACNAGVHKIGIPVSVNEGHSHADFMPAGTDCACGCTSLKPGVAQFAER